MALPTHLHGPIFDYREVVERRAHIVTGKKPTEAEIDNMIDTGESETIFQKAILEQGRGHVSVADYCLSMHLQMLPNICDSLWKLPINYRATNGQADNHTAIIVALYSTSTV